MQWSPDSEFLAVVLEKRRGEGAAETVQLWKRSNWKWYLKKELRYDLEVVDLHACLVSFRGYGRASHSHVAACGAGSCHACVGQGQASGFDRGHLDGRF